MFASVAASLAVVLTEKEDRASEKERERLERERERDEISLSVISRTKLLCKLFLLRSRLDPAPLLVLPQFVWTFQVFVFPPQRGGDARCCLVAGQTCYGQISDRVVPIEKHRVRSELLVTL